MSQEALQLLREKFGDSAMNMQQPEDDMNVQESSDLRMGAAASDSETVTP